jgi:hypothetical protein
MVVPEAGRDKGIASGVPSHIKLDTPYKTISCDFYRSGFSEEIVTMS